MAIRGLPRPKMPTADSPDAMLSAIIEQLFDRLSEPSHHGELLVERAIGYLVAVQERPDRR